MAIKAAKFISNLKPLIGNRSRRARSWLVQCWRDFAHAQIAMCCLT